MERIARAALAATLSILLVAGGSLALTQTSAEDLATLQAAPWTLSELDGQSVPASAGITTRFGADGSLDGFAGCNTYAGSYEVDEAIITVGPIASTRIACEQDVMDTENLFLDLLQNAGTWSLDGPTLTVTAADGGVLVFGGEAVVEPAPFAGTEWTLTAVDGVEVPEGSGVTAVFSEDFTVAGFGGCNQYNGGYSIDGDTIAIGPLAATRKACEQEVMELEFSFLDTMEAADLMSITGTTLTLIVDIGIGELTFSAEGGSETPAVAFTGTPWYLVDLDGDPAVAADGATVTFGDDGSITGFGGCNQLFGSYTIDGSTIVVEGLAATRIFCEGEVMDREALLAFILNDATTVSLDEDELTITASDGAELIFATEPGTVTPLPTPAATTAPVATDAPVASPGASTDGVVGPTWQLTQLAGQDISSFGLTITITFHPDGTVSGNGGCNDFTGTYTLDGTSLSLSGITPGTESCSAMAASIEQALLPMVPFFDTVSVVDGELHLDSSFGIQTVWTPL